MNLPKKKKNKNLRVYENYINNYVNAMNTLQKCMKLAPFKKFIDVQINFSFFFFNF